jgi:Protein kinase domain
LLDAGETVAGYRVDGLLGEGGMGAVYRATQLSLNRTVALKVLSAEFGDDAGFRERFRREGQLQAALDHAHIVTVYEAGETEHGLFLAMRLVRGPTLKDMILSKELDTDRSIAILGSVADALDSAHDVGLIHRDVKPQNILVGARDHAYLADFGLTKATGEGGLTETGQFMGTIDYVAPEQVQGEGATARSDVYSLTGVLYECLAGEPPFSKPTEAAVLYAHITDPPPTLREKRPDLPEAIDEVIARGMAKQPDERYATASEFLREAATALGKSAGTIPLPEVAPAASEAASGVTAASEPIPGGQTAAASTRLAGAPTAPAGVPPAAPAAPARAAAVRRGPPFALVAVGVAVALAVVGFVAGGSGSEEKGVDFGSSASAGSLGLSFPASWERLSEEPGVPGVDMSDPIVLAPGSGRQGQLAAGLVAAAGPSLLPATFTKRLPDQPPPGDPVSLGKIEAYRYEGLRPKGLDGRVTLYTAPTSGGVATIACTARGQATDLLEECEAVATTLELSGVKAFALGPNEAYARSLGGALGKLGSARKSGEAALRSATTQDGQGAAAGRLADAYAAAAQTLARAEVSPADQVANGRIVAALRGVGGAYRRAASAARAGDGGAYAAATDAVRSGGRRLERALGSLEELGYSVS